MTGQGHIAGEKHVFDRACIAPLTVYVTILHEPIDMDIFAEYKCDNSRSVHCAILCDIELRQMERFRNHVQKAVVNDIGQSYDLNMLDMANMA